MTDFSEVGPVVGVTDEIPLLVLGTLVSPSGLGCLVRTRFFGSSTSKLICFLFALVLCFLVDADDLTN